MILFSCVFNFFCCCCFFLRLLSRARVGMHGCVVCCVDLRYIHSIGLQITIKNSIDTKKERRKKTTNRQKFVLSFGNLLWRFMVVVYQMVLHLNGNCCYVFGLGRFHVSRIFRRWIVWGSIIYLADTTESKMKFTYKLVWSLLIELIEK